jgi:hypothetical protein
MHCQVFHVPESCDLAESRGAYLAIDDDLGRDVYADDLADDNMSASPVPSDRQVDDPL